MRYFPVNIDVTGLLSDIKSYYDENNQFDSDIFTNGYTHPYESFETVQWPAREIHSDKTGKEKYGLTDQGNHTYYRKGETSDKGTAVGEIITEWVFSKVKHLPIHICLQNIKANYEVPKHVDIVERNCVLIINISKENFFGTTHYTDEGEYQVPYFPCYVLNTQIRHGTPPVNRNRTTINMPYDQDIYTIKEIYDNGNLFF